MLKNIYVVIFLLVVLFNLSAPSALAASKRIAITIDDFPGWQPVAEGKANFTLASLASTLNDRKIPATGFVIGELSQRTEDSKRSLESWAKAGLPLANHSWDHRPYSSASTQRFWNGVNKTEQVLASLRDKYGLWPTAFRFPMLNQGKNSAQENAANRYLAGTKTLLAHVSIDNSDWAFARAYDEARKTAHPTLLKKIEDLYIEHIFDCVAYAEEASEKIYGRQISQVLLLHSNSLNVAKLGAILDGLASRGYDFISFEDALKDAVYQPFLYKIAYQAPEHFFVQAAHLLNKPLPEPDRSRYEYFQKYWEPKLKGIK